MTKAFGTYHLTLELRNGVGLDLEFADSRPVWVFSQLEEDIVAMSFEGIIFLVPFLMLTLGRIYTVEEE